MVALIGIVGYTMMVLRFEAAPLLLGFILGPQMEENLRYSLLLSRGDPMVFLQRPISATLLTVGAMLLMWSLWSALRRPARAAAAARLSSPESEAVASAGPCSR